MAAATEGQISEWDREAEDKAADERRGQRAPPFWQRRTKYCTVRALPAGLMRHSYLQNAGIPPDGSHTRFFDYSSTFSQGFLAGRRGGAPQTRAEKVPQYHSCSATWKICEGRLGRMRSIQCNALVPVQPQRGVQRSWPSSFAVNPQ